MISRLQPRDNVRSNVYRLPRHLRRRADIAIIERCPPTLMAIWMELELGKHGVTYMSFNRYARRLRDRVNLADVAHLTGTQQADLNDKLHVMAARQLLETLLNEDNNFEPRQFATLVTALRQMTRTEYQNRKLSEESRLAWARVENERKTLQLNQEKLELFRRKFLDPVELKSLSVDDAAAQQLPAPPLRLADAPEEPELLAASLPKRIIDGDTRPTDSDAPTKPI